MNPRIDIDYNKLKHNAATIVGQCRKQGIHIVAVTKGFCAIPQIAQAIFEGGVKYFGDSRLENLIKLKDFPIEKILLRLPMISQAEAVVKHADISLNSEIETIKVLNQYAKKSNKLHKIVLMIDLGDLREGIFDEEEIDAVCDLLKELTNIKVVGIGTNLTCFGGVIPEEKNLTRLVDLGRHIEEALDIQLEMISGGNSSSFYLLEKGGLVKEINQLRLGEAILLGTESAYGENIQGVHQDVFTLVAEIIEIKEKPSMPIGKIGRDAFGNVPVFVDQGIRKRAILAIGKQDLATHKIYPTDSSIKIIGSSSDHLIVDITDVSKALKIGDELRFHVGYGAMLALMTSEYVYKKVIR
ncbi:ornithine racemase Orr [Clostridium formicaceticum]|uniref:Alanine racemase n=1 Tax=Clostridium formicaceticum TaxID=1497 RepID=A0AAC9WG47_9CLOT|nr:ornithine racemase Orr [Clostridium formicaceticum]AOY76967.1 alanine racemase [Clostridium formicaceticum]ARE87451.1 alanine racemase [Clostridium formicaceticum]